MQLEFKASFEGGTTVIDRDVPEILGFTNSEVRFGLLRSVVCHGRTNSDYEYHKTDIEGVRHILKSHGVSEDLAVSAIA